MDTSLNISSTKVGEIGFNIEAKALQKDFVGRSGQVISAVGPLEYEIKAGEFFSLVGPSGCGKSTFLRLVAGLIAPTDGEIYLGGTMVREPSDQVGIVFQRPTLLPWRTILENVTMPLRIAKQLDKSSLERARSLLDIVGLSKFVNNYPRELSGGMQQRVSIARALIKSPPVVLMDEPFGALDEFTRESMNEELLRIWSLERSTILFITHSISEAVFMSDRIGVMTSGPGRLLDVVEVNLPRPRTSAERNSDEFYNYVRSVRSILDSAYQSGAKSNAQ